MPPAAEPVSERLVAAVVATLAGITAGVTYWHDTAKAITDPHFYAGHMDESLDSAKACYVVSPDQDEDTPVTFTDIETRVELDVIAYKKFEPASERPWDASPPKRGTVQRRLAADVKNAIRAVEGLPTVVTGGATRAWVPFTHMASDETLFKGWAVVMLRVVIETTHGPVGA